jgi:hypothetical protein
MRLKPRKRARIETILDLPCQMGPLCERTQSLTERAL